MPTKAQELDKIINYHENLIGILKDNLSMVKGNGKKLGIINMVSGKELTDMRKKMSEAYKIINELTFRKF